MKTPSISLHHRPLSCPDIHPQSRFVQSRTGDARAQDGYHVSGIHLVTRGPAGRTGRLSHGVRGAPWTRRSPRSARPGTRSEPPRRVLGSHGHGHGHRRGLLSARDSERAGSRQSWALARAALDPRSLYVHRFTGRRGDRPSQSEPIRVNQGRGAMVAGVTESAGVRGGLGLRNPPSTRISTRISARMSTPILTRI